ncbi:hypothetical protein [Nitrosomonas sp. Nm132]|uniref:hypothetical protein n=1 Tax=Nitrosomonas sp. Nm132 TaxID=1881053 RepID=UPI000B83A81E|nr:hypothetical protein [Nitrosomonas sp. Nm132]
MFSSYELIRRNRNYNYGCYARLYSASMAQRQGLSLAPIPAKFTAPGGGHPDLPPHQAFLP